MADCDDPFEFFTLLTFYEDDKAVQAYGRGPSLHDGVRPAFFHEVESVSVAYRRSEDPADRRCRPILLFDLGSSTHPACILSFDHGFKADGYRPEACSVYFLTRADVDQRAPLRFVFPAQYSGLTINSILVRLYEQGRDDGEPRILTRNFYGMTDPRDAM